MSIKYVREEINRFLSSTKPEVLCVKGKWGIGKTYAWNFYLKEISDQGKLGLNKYAYVSLFGLKSLDDLKYSLFESTTGIEQLESGPNINSLKKSLKWLKGNYKKPINFVVNIPFINQYIGGSERTLFFAVRNQIVCIDDLERSGADLNIKDVFGLVSYLKEQRGCKVVLLLNDEELSDTNKEDFKKQLEKVTDTVLNFNPSPKESVDIAFPDPKGIEILIYKNCLLLGITNIRVIKKIQRDCERLQELLGKKYPDLIKQAVHTATLFGWVKHQPQEAPTIDFLQDISRIHGLGDNKNASEREKTWQGLLKVYEFSNTDEFDLVILEGLQLGYFDTEKLYKVAEKSNSQIQKANQENSFNKAWDAYHDSFDDNEKAVMKGLYDSAIENSNIISPINLDSTVILLKEFGMEKQAKSLIAHYVKVRADEKELFDTRRSSVFGELKDPDLARAFKEKLASFRDKRDPGTVLSDIVTNHGWNPEDLQMISRLTEDDFYKLFKKSKGINMHRIVRGALQFKTIASASEEMILISDRATAALVKIASESQLNARRVRTHGVTVNDTKKF